MADVQCGVLVSLWELQGKVGSLPGCLAGPFETADVNCDTKVNVTDVTIFIQIALNLPLDAGLDVTGDKCPDACQPPTLAGPPVVVPTSFHGVSSGGGFTVRPLGFGAVVEGESAGGGLKVKPKAVGAPNP